MTIFRDVPFKRLIKNGERIFEDRQQEFEANEKPVCKKSAKLS